MLTNNKVVKKKVVVLHQSREQQFEDNSQILEELENIVNTANADKKKIAKDFGKVVEPVIYDLNNKLAKYKIPKKFQLPDILLNELETQDFKDRILTTLEDIYKNKFHNAYDVRIYYAMSLNTAKDIYTNFLHLYNDLTHYRLRLLGASLRNNNNEISSDGLSKQNYIIKKSTKLNKEEYLEILHKYFEVYSFTETFVSYVYNKGKQYHRRYLDFMEYLCVVLLHNTKIALKSKLLSKNQYDFYLKRILGRDDTSLFHNLKIIRSDIIERNRNSSFYSGFSNIIETNKERDKGYSELLICNSKVKKYLREIDSKINALKNNHSSLSLLKKIKLLEDTLQLCKEYSFKPEAYADMGCFIEREKTIYETIVELLISKLKSKLIGLEIDDKINSLIEKYFLDSKRNISEFKINILANVIKKNYKDEVYKKNIIDFYPLVDLLINSLQIFDRDSLDLFKKITKLYFDHLKINKDLLSKDIELFTDAINKFKINYIALGMAVDIFYDDYKIKLNIVDNKEQILNITTAGDTIDYSKSAKTLIKYFNSKILELKKHAKKCLGSLSPRHPISKHCLYMDQKLNKINENIGNVNFTETNDYNNNTNNFKINKQKLNKLLI